MVSVLTNIVILTVLTTHYLCSIQLDFVTTGMWYVLVTATSGARALES